MTPRGLQGRTVLLLEDNFLIGLEMTAYLEQLGLQVMGPCATGAEARAAIEQGVPDFAVLDVRLREGTSVSFASELDGCGVACIFVTGYSTIPDLPETLGHLPRLGKPIDPDALKSALEGLGRRSV